MAAVPPRVAPLSTEKLGEAAVVRRVSEAVALVYASAPRLAFANGASNIPDSVDTTRVAAHGRSSQFRTGSTLDHQTSSKISPPLHRQPALSAPSTGVEAGFRVGLARPVAARPARHTTIHSFHSFNPQR